MKAGGDSEVWVDGEPWHKRYPIKSVSVVHAMGAATQLVVDLSIEGIIEGEGIVVQRVNSPMEVAAWVGAIDPDQLRKAVESELNGPNPAPYEELVLRVLAKWANGQ